MLAITTKFINPTNSKPSRIKAQAAYASLTIAWDHSLNTEQNHRAAAVALIRKLSWHSSATERNLYGAFWASGEIKGGYVFVNHSEHPYHDFNSIDTRGWV